MADSPSFTAFSGFDEIADQLPDVGDFTSTPPPPSSPGPESPSSYPRYSGVPQVTTASIDWLGLAKLFGFGKKEEPAPSPAEPVVEVRTVQIKDIFKMSQTDKGYSFNSHPAILMAVAYMQKSLDYSWREKPVRETIFPNIKSALAPASLTVDGLEKSKFDDGAVGLLVKAFYNACQDRQGSIEIDKANSAVQSLNDHISTQATPLLVQFYRAFFFLHPSDELVHKYKTLLLSSAYRNMKQHQASQGFWPHASLEMFCHFAKLAACGASDEQIREVYVGLTTTEPKLDPGSFGEIRPESWRAYRAWLSSGYLDWGDLNAEHLDASYTEVTSSGGMYPYGPVMSTYTVSLADDFIRSKSYWKAPQSSSCFAGDTRVVMADGTELKRISDIKTGDLVLTGTTSRRVAFVSSPRRNARTLYSLAGYPGVKFTETHPILSPPGSADDAMDDDQVGNVVSFVNKDLASSLNPTWQSLRTENISQDLLQACNECDDEGEILYDLVFEPNLGGDSHQSVPLASYVLEATNGRRLIVASEAPVIEWFPLETIFISCAVERMTSQVEDIGATAELVGSNKICTRSLLTEAAAKITTTNAADPIVNSKDIDESLIASRLLHACAESQPTAELAEKVVAYAGRTLSHEIKNGWARPVAASDVSSGQSVLFLNVVRLLDNIDGARAWTISADYHLKVWAENEIIFDGSVSGSIQGNCTLDLHYPILLDRGATEEGLLTCRSIAMELSDPSSSSAWYGAGPIRDGIQSVISLGDTPKVSGMATQHGVAEVELRTVEVGMDSASLASLHHAWHPKDMVTYAQELGIAFGELVLGVFEGSRK
ncbi:hypothetical protein PG997_015372 [Apiospora hydei]|uniref:Uncharacterized protein n=1 Tax=Apiospora hydei TaxID=1337664 RepID=A0ABR1UQH0_9PEZI